MPGRRITLTFRHQQAQTYGTVMEPFCASMRFA